MSSGLKLNLPNYEPQWARDMRLVPYSRLDNLSQRYCRKTEIPPGEAFVQAFSRYMKANRESLLDIAAAVSTSYLSVDANPSDVDPLLIKAIYETNPSLTESHLFSMSDAARQGAVNTAKGKYFEYLVADKLEQGQQVGPLMLQNGQHAVLADAMNQPGWDLQITDSHGHVIEYLQLKATDSVGYIHMALKRYPDIHILSTSEVAQSGLVLDSGISEHALQHHVEAGMSAADTSLTESFLDYFNPLLPLAAMASYEGYRLVIGEQSIDSFKLAMARRGQRMVATKLVGATVYALGGGYLAIPAAIAGGLVFDRTINQAEMMTAYSEYKGKLLALRLMQQERELQGA
jgi:hypothetical protein